MMDFAPQSAAAQRGRIQIAPGEALSVQDSGLVQTALLRTAFGFEIAPVVSAQDGEERAVTEADMAAACRKVVAERLVHIGGAAPDFVFFSITTRDNSIGFFRLGRTDRTWFEIARGRCRPAQEPDMIGK